MRGIIVAIMILSSLQGYGQKIAFDHIEFDFGEIYETSNSVIHEFPFKNEGDAPLVILNIVTSCRCTEATYPKKPIPAGGSGVIKIKFDPKGQAGQTYKVIQVFNNGKERGRAMINLKGRVNKK